MAAPVTVVILAAGQGTRMRSRVPKVLHPICGRPMIEWPVRAAREAGADRIVVVGGPDRALDGRLPDGVELAVQAEPRGTGDAVLAAADHIDDDATVVVLMGDVPLVTAEAIRRLTDAHRTARAAATMLTMVLEDPGSYGRVVRDADGSVLRVVEAKAPGDATPEELAVREVNTGLYAFAGGPLIDGLGRVTPDNAQNELYLPGVLPVLAESGLGVAAHQVDDPALTLGVNDRVDLATVRAHAQRRINEAHMRAGVTIVDPASAHIDVEVELGEDTVVEPGTVLRGATRAGRGCRIGPLTTLTDCTLGDDVTVLHVHGERAELHDGVSVGPWARLRPGTVVRAGARIGTFVELKNSDIGEGTKVPHLSYLGDADVGPNSNIGAANVTANYDGRDKHRTRIGANVKTSVDTTFVAPVSIGDDAWTGAGSVITDDVPPGALGIARERQTNVEDYARRKSE